MFKFSSFHMNHSSRVVLKSWLPISYLEQLRHNLHARQEAKNLATRDNHVLRDIGVYRADVETATQLDLAIDALEELHKAQLHHFDAYEVWLSEQCPLEPTAANK